MEIKIEVLTRVPPGDRWMEPLGDGTRIFPSLTAGLEHIFGKTQCKQYYFDAGLGKVYMLQQEQDPEPIIPTYNIYGDR